MKLSALPESRCSFDIDLRLDGPAPKPDFQAGLGLQIFTWSLARKREAPRFSTIRPCPLVVWGHDFHKKFQGDDRPPDSALSSDIPIFSSLCSSSCPSIPLDAENRVELFQVLELFLFLLSSGKSLQTFLAASQKSNGLIKWHHQFFRYIAIQNYDPPVYFSVSGHWLVCC